MLADSYLADLPALPAADLRFRRREAMQEETDLSYLRRLIQGRLDTLKALLAERGGAESTPASTGQPAQSSARPSSPRYLGLTPGRLGEARRADEELVARSGLVDPDELSDEELDALIGDLLEQERRINGLRTRVQHAADELSAEMTRRLKSGEMDPLASLGE